MSELANKPQPISDSEWAFIDEGRADWFTRRLLATIRDRDAQIEQLKAQLAARPARKSKKQIAEDLKESDLTAQAVGGRPDIDYGPHDSTPRCEHVVNVRK